MSETTAKLQDEANHRDWLRQMRSVTWHLVKPDRVQELIHDIDELMDGMSLDIHSRFQVQNVQQAREAMAHYAFVLGIYRRKLAKTLGGVSEF